MKFQWWKIWLLGEVVSMLKSLNRIIMQAAHLDSIYVGLKLLPC